jgi:hypothetical protein
MLPTAGKLSCRPLNIAWIHRMIGPQLSMLSFLSQKYNHHSNKQYYLRKLQTVSCNARGEERGPDDDEKLGVQEEMQGQELGKSVGTYARKDQENDKERAKDEMGGEEAGNNGEDEDETLSASPDLLREKELIESATRALADSIRPGRRSSNHYSNKRPLEDTVPAGPPSKRSKAATHVDNEFRAAGTTTTSAENPVDQSFWDEWDIKRAAMTNHDQQTDQSVKAVRVWRRLSTKHSSGLSRSRRGQDTSLRNVNKLVTMVLAVANCYAFGALKEVMGFLQQDRAAGSSEIFSNDPKVLMETVSTIETAGHLNSYLRRFTLARLANIYTETAANGGCLTLHRFCYDLLVCICLMQGTGRYRSLW